jgi:serine/threonine-protein phosphatase 6 catalytic subunit
VLPRGIHRCGNMASIMTVHENGERTFTVYDAAEENERDRGKVTGRMVGRFCVIIICL